MLKLLIVCCLISFRVFSNEKAASHLVNGLVGEYYLEDSEGEASCLSDVVVQYASETKILMFHKKGVGFFQEDEEAHKYVLGDRIKKSRLINHGQSKKQVYQYFYTYFSVEYKQSFFYLDLRVPNFFATLRTMSELQIFDEQHMRLIKTSYIDSELEGRILTYEKCLYVKKDVVKGEYISKNGKDTL